MKIPLHRVSTLLYNTPLLLTPEVGRTISSVLERERAARGFGSGDDEAAEQFEVFQPVERADGTTEIYAPKASRFVGQTPIDPNTGRPKPYAVTPNGTGIITIVGETVNRGRWIGASSGIVSYEGIIHQAAEIAKDDTVKSVILDIESPGGAAIGAFNAVAAIRKLAATKRVVAYLNGFAASAGYALASGASRIIVIPEGKAGSIGVLWMHVDFSVALQLEGIKPTFVFAGAHKIDGSPFQPLPDSVRARVQADVNAMYDMFVANVAMGRKGMTEDSIRATEAQVYNAAEAKSLGLVDDIGALDDLLVELEQPETMTVVMNGGGAKSQLQQPGEAASSAAQEEEEMANKPNLWQQLMTALGGETATETPAAVSAAGTVAVAVPHEHTALGDADCAGCLKAEIARRDTALAKQKADDEATAAANAEVAAKELAAQLNTQADLICAKYDHKMGKAAAEAFKAGVVEALSAGQEGKARLANLEAIAAGLPDVGAVRINTVGAPSAEALAGTVTEGGAALSTHHAALAIVAAKGVTASDPRFAAEYDAARAQISGGVTRAA